MKPKFEDVEREIRRLAHEHPDRKAGCHYTALDGPHCIVGHALHRLGVSVRDLRKLEGLSASDTVDKNGTDLRALFWLNSVQLEQDARIPWSKAVDKADRQLFRE